MNQENCWIRCPAIEDQQNLLPQQITVMVKLEASGYLRSIITAVGKSYHLRSLLLASKHSGGAASDELSNGICTGTVTSNTRSDVSVVEQLIIALIPVRV